MSIESVKNIKGFNSINAEEYFIIDQPNATRRQNSFKIIRKRFLTNEDKHFFPIESLA